MQSFADARVDGLRVDGAQRGREYYPRAEEVVQTRAEHLRTGRRRLVDRDRERERLPSKVVAAAFEIDEIVDRAVHRQHALEHGVVDRRDQPARRGPPTRDLIVTFPW